MKEFKIKLCQQKNSICLGIVLCIIFAFLGFYKFIISNNESANVSKTENQELAFGLVRIEKYVTGNSMEPLIKNGQKVNLIPDYYKYYPLKRDDFVAYPRTNDILIKRVKVFGGDKMEFKNDELWVNDQILKNSADQVYKFTEPQKNMISLYIQDGKLIKDACLIFGENPYDSMDSRRFGAVSQDSFVGKFEL